MTAPSGVERSFSPNSPPTSASATLANFIFLEEGDVGEIRRNSVRILDKDGNAAQRPAKLSELSADAAEKGEFEHYMLKEIHEQPDVLARTTFDRIDISNSDVKLEGGASWPNRSAGSSPRRSPSWAMSG